MVNRSQFLNRPLPSSEESERIVLGAILLNNDLITEVYPQLQEDAFYVLKNRRVFKAMITLFKEMKEITAVTIFEDMKLDGSINSIGGISGIAALIHGLPLMTNISMYVNLLYDKWYSRRLIKASMEISEEALNEELNREALSDYAEHKICSLAMEGEKGGLEIAEDSINRSIELSHIRAELGSTVIGLPTGFIDLDNKLQGMREGDLIVIAARPSIGKTTLALNIGQRVAINEDKVVSIFSMEMSSDDLAEKIIVSESQVDSLKYRLGHLQQDEWEKVEEAREKILSKHLYIDDSPNITPFEMRAKIRRLQNKIGKKVDLIIVDYLQLMGSGNKENRQSEITELSRQMKLIAREFNCPLIELSQLSRKPENRSDHRPTLSDLRESGAIEQDADVVIFIYREDFYVDNPQFHNHKAEILVAKNRKGAIGKSELLFAGDRSTFMDSPDSIQNQQEDF
jgi:replicative DNA helicase